MSTLLEGLNLLDIEITLENVCITIPGTFLFFAVLYIFTIRKSKLQHMSPL